MTNKKMNKKATVNVTVRTPSPPATTKKTKSKSRPKVVSTPAWYNSVCDPFNHEPVAIPDQETAASVKYTTRNSAVIYTTDVNATPSTVHGCLLGILPIAQRDDQQSVGNFCYSIKGWNSIGSGSGFTGSVGSALTTTGQPVNSSAMFPNPISSGSSQQMYAHRLTSMAVKITPLMPELFRGGEIVVGLAEMAEDNIPCTSVNAINMVFGNAFTTSTNITESQVFSRMRRMDPERMPDGSIIARWVPFGVPNYTPVLTSANAATTNRSAFFEAGPAMFIMILGDRTEVASGTGNEFEITMVQHWEVRPPTRTVLVVNPTPSPYDPTALAYCLNNFQLLSSTIIEDGTGIRVGRDGHQTSVGSAWEGIGRLANAAYQFASTPRGQQLLMSGAQMGINYARSRRGAQRLIRG